MCIKWANERCVLDKKPKTVENLRHELRDILPAIRFPLMTAYEFLKDVQEVS